MNPLVPNAGIEEVRKHSTWFLAVGIALVILGMVAIGYTVVMIANPGRAAVILTLLIAIILIFAGLFRLFIAFSTQLHHRGWLILNGAISIVLGIMIWDAWPVSGLWVIGLFIGIDMIFDGWTEIILALSARRLPA
jgi:uncharacterized membrane protein HdeD (DUF308 family)